MISATAVSSVLVTVKGVTLFALGYIILFICSVYVPEVVYTLLPIDYVHDSRVWVKCEVRVCVVVICEVSCEVCGYWSPTSVNCFMNSVASLRFEPKITPNHFMSANRTLQTQDS